MATLNVSLPAALKSFVEQQVADRGYDSCSAYVRELIRRDRDYQTLWGMLLDGARSPPSVVADEAYFESLRADIRRRNAMT